MTTGAPSQAIVYLGLGSNLEQPIEQLRTALRALAALPDGRLLACSALYRTAPVGPADQPDYINAAACLRTRLPPLELLQALQRIEQAQGRRRDGTRWGPRTLDLDVLLYDDRRIALQGLRIPHPEMGRRAFVLIPLAEIAPADLHIPGQGSLRALLARCDPSGVERLADEAAGLDHRLVEGFEY